MAEVNIQRRSANAVWWILGVLALLIVIWAVFAWVDDPGEYGVGRTSVEQPMLAGLVTTLAIS